MNRKYLVLSTTEATEQHNMQIIKMTRMVKKVIGISQAITILKIAKSKEICIP